MPEDGGCRGRLTKSAQSVGFPNRWNFEGWREVCEAKPVPMAEAKDKGWV